MTKGIIIGGRVGEILARQKKEEPIELGELLIAEAEGKRILLQVYDLLFGSQLSQQNLELLSGIKLEETTNLEFMQPHERTYTLAVLKALAEIDEKNTKSAKTLPAFFSELREVRNSDLCFTKPNNSMYFGQLRSGSKTMDVPLHLDGKNVISHHVLIPATTGRGKSNLMKVLLWDLVDKEYAGILVLDPHDEYYRGEPGLKDHPNKEAISYYSMQPTPGQSSLIIEIGQIKPAHMRGAVNWTQAQSDCVYAYYKQYKNHWIEAVLKEKPLEVNIHEMTLGVVKRRLLQLLRLELHNDEIVSSGPFSTQAGKSTLSDIAKHLEQSKIVVIDTSTFEGTLEIMIGSMVTHEVFSRYKQYKIAGVLQNKPCIGIVIEEAPRVLGQEVLEQGPNIFSTIAREGRKFQVGLLAITQLPSLIPRQIRANMNTKIILGIEMKPERQAIIESAAQDISQDDRTIASLNKGEAIITSNFAPFALPIQIPFFNTYIKTLTKKMPSKKNYVGIGFA